MAQKTNQCVLYAYVAAARSPEVVRLQLRDVRAYARKRWQIARQFSDFGRDRRGLAQMLAFCERVKPAAVVVRDRSRLSRFIDRRTEIMTRLKSQGIRVISLIDSDPEWIDELLTVRFKVERQERASH